MKEKQSAGVGGSGGGGSHFKSSKKVMKKIDKVGSRPSVGGAPTGGKKNDKSTKLNEDVSVPC